MEKENLVRKELLTADHNAYHTGALALIRQVLNTWPPGQRPLSRSSCRYSRQRHRSSSFLP